jgi:hypothetical protein
MVGGVLALLPDGAAVGQVVVYLRARDPALVLVVVGVEDVVDPLPVPRGVEDRSWKLAVAMEVKFNSAWSSSSKASNRALRRHSRGFQTVPINGSTPLPKSRFSLASRPGPSFMSPQTIKGISLVSSAVRYGSRNWSRSWEAWARILRRLASAICYHLLHS